MTTDRLLGLWYWIVPFFVAAGALGTFRLMRTLARDRRVAVLSSVGAVLVLATAALLRHRLAAMWTGVFGSPTVNLYALGTFSALAHLGPWWPSMVAVAGALLAAWLILALDVRRSLGARSRPSPGAARIAMAAAPVAIVALVSL